MKKSMKKRKKDLKLMTDDELVSLGKKNGKLCLIFDMIKWSLFVTCMYGAILASPAVSPIFVFANILNIGVVGTGQVIFANKCSKCKDILKSRGSLYKYNFDI